MKRLSIRLVGLGLWVWLTPWPAVAQGPSPAYFHDPSTEVPWASCESYQPGGSHQRVPFLPAGVRHPDRAPAGTLGYTRDVTFDGPLVMVGDGLGEDDEPTVDLAGAVVLMRLGGRGELEALETRLSVLSRLGATAAVVFPLTDAAPFPAVDSDLLPVVAVTRATVERMLAAHSPIAGSLLEDWSASRVPPPPEAMNLRLRCTYEGAFEALETSRFVVRYRETALSADQVEELARVNEDSVDLLLTTFPGHDLEWSKHVTTFFRGFDTKVFYTHHWGFGLATANRSYLVYQGAPDPGLVTHENAHVLFDRSWGETSSFVSEGIGRHAEAVATDAELNHRETLANLHAGRLFPLARMVDFEIGMPGAETDIGYPAAGSFVAYLLERRGLAAFRQIWTAQAGAEERAVSGWRTVYGEDLDELERSWHEWLGSR